MVGGLVCGLFTRYWTPELAHGSVPAALQGAHRPEPAPRGRTGLARALATTSCVGTGGSGGDIGPMLHAGSALADLAARRVGLTGADRRALLGTGAAAAITGTVGAPVGAALLTLALIVREPGGNRGLRPGLVVPVLAGAATGAVLRWLLLDRAPWAAMPAASLPSGPPAGLAAGSSPDLFTTLVTGPVTGLPTDSSTGLLTALPTALPTAAVAAPSTGLSGLSSLSSLLQQAPGWAPLLLAVGLVAVLGLAAALVGAVYVEALHRTSSAIGRYWRGPAHFCPAIGGLLLVPVVAIAPELLLGGPDHMATAPALTQRSMAVLACLLLVKIAATAVTLGSGGSGGTIGPGLVIGALLGGIAGHLVGDGSGGFAVVGMAAVMAAGSRLPLPAIALATEFTGRFDLLPPTIGAALVASLAVRWLTPSTVFGARSWPPGGRGSR